MTLTIRGDRRAFRRPALELYRNNEIIHSQQFTVSNDLPLRLDFHLGCSLFKAKGLYEVSQYMVIIASVNIATLQVRVIGTPGTPPVYTTGKKLLDSYPDFNLSFMEDEVEALSREIMVVGMFNKRAICHQSESLIVVKMESIESEEELEHQDDFAIYIRFPSDALKIPCSAFNRPGQYRLTAVLDGDVISHSKPLTVLPSTQYALSIKRRTLTNLNRIELDQCRPDGDGYFDVDYVAPPCAANHKLKLEPRHQSRRFELTPKIFDLTPHSNTIRLKCKDIHHAAHGACLHYLDEFGATQATLCFALPGKPTPPIDGQWTRWGDERKCTAPCDLAGLGDVTYTSAGLNDQSEWTVKQRQCASPAALGNGRKCNTQTTQVANDVNKVQVEYSVDQSSCRNPWQLARQIVVTESGSESCECGCTKQVDSAAIAIFSPAPWRCRDSSSELNWTFECKDCDSIIMHVLHFDLDESEQLFIHESEDKIFRIDSIGSTQHQTKTVKIRYQLPGRQSGCGFAIRLAFSQSLLIPNNSHGGAGDQLPITDLALSEDTAANLGLWGILVCSGFLIILLVASIMNCRSSNSGENEAIDKHHHHHVVTSHDKVYSSTQETDVMLDESFSRSPTKIKPNAATYSLAQHQLRLMKQGGQVSGMFLWLSRHS